MKFKENLFELKKLGYKPTEMHTEQLSGCLNARHEDDIYYHQIETLLIIEWLRKYKLLDINVRCSIDGDDEGHEWVIYSGSISIIQKNGKCKYQIDYEDADHFFTYFECVDKAITASIDYILDK